MKDTLQKIPYIYADNAATTRVSPTAVSAMLPYFDTLYGLSLIHIYVYKRQACIRSSGPMPGWRAVSCWTA